jgi:hypothetical protein
MEARTMRLIPIALVCVLSLRTFAADEPGKKVAEFLGAGVVDVLRNADKVEVFRVGNSEHSKQETLAGHSVISKGKDQDKDKEFAGKLRDILFDEKTYDFGSAKECKFNPGVAFRVLSGDKTILVLLCFTCKELMIVGGSETKERYEDFDGSAAKLTALAKLGLPDDKEIQALK